MDYIVAIGRRKTSVARVFVTPAAKSGKGKIVINDKEFEKYLPVDVLQIKVLQPFKILNKSAADYDIKVNVKGGGFTGQAEAIRLGISRVFIKMDEELKSPLRKAGFVTRDPRMVERKKYGQPKARKKTQFSKR